MHAWMLVGFVGGGVTGLVGYMIAGFVYGFVAIQPETLMLTGLLSAGDTLLLAKSRKITGWLSDLFTEIINDLR